MYVPPMFEWPRFAAHLDGSGRPPEKRVGALLAELGEWAFPPSAKEVLRTLFQDPALADAVGLLAPRLHHVGLIAPPRLDPAAIESEMRASPFRNQMRKFKSVVVARELSARMGRSVDVMVMRGSLGTPSVGCPSVEIFVADLPANEIADLVADEIGCHVALELAPNGSLARVLEVLHAHGRWEIPLMRGGPLTNHEIHSSVLFVDVPGEARTRRLEVIAADAPDAAAVLAR
jgi:hypothetical protein